jgi:transposase
MENLFSLKNFNNRFPDDDSCLEEIKRLKHPKGIHCVTCNKITKHYKVRKRTAYACKFCRNQIYPLAGTIFEKTATPLRVWFYALLLMTQSEAGISSKQLERELGVTYKTAWRISKRIRMLMKQGDLLSQTNNKVKKWIFFNKLEIKVVEKHEPSL